MLRHLVALLVVLGVGCDSGGAPGPGVSGRVALDPDFPSDIGVVFFERGRVHSGTFERFAVIGEDGYFEHALPVGGTWGVHVFVEGHFCLPLDVEVEEDFVTRLGPEDIEMIRDSDPSNNPRIREASVERVGDEVVRVSMTAEDPDPDLSREQLVGHEESGIGLALNPPGPAVDGVYPEGPYEAAVYLPEGTDPDGSWWFVISDLRCSISSIEEERAD